ncbi:DNA replication and repair protein RecN [Natranaerovirga pectinivora]|uniref:DNA repair protein RecN n=1 Tax=Natranaerovirga pectinivora TaxID=682400 RepID=A0A4R3MT88_9FIRM|nr:DNA replication and repair protein RecN [Natranaerovirga pectinivora]
MLVYLHVKNLALIDEVEVDFNQGLNILTGETGAGKSIIIDSINSALGAKTSKDIIRTGCDYALIELLFTIEDPHTIERIKSYDIPIDDNNEVLITRKINTNGRSVHKINGQSATALMIKNIASYLIDIHGQHEHQSLLNKSKHLEILDQFCGEELEENKRILQDLYKKYINQKKKLQEQAMDEDKRQREISFLEFEINEIETARLQQGEDEEVNKVYKLLSNSREITEVLNKVYDFTGSGVDLEVSVSNSIGKAIKLLSHIDKMDDGLTSIKDQFINVENLLNDINREILHFIDNITVDEEELFKAEERMNCINALKSKYGNSISDILKYLDESKEKHFELQNYEILKNQLEEALKKTEHTINEVCENITKIRLQKSKEIAKEIKKSLVDLNFLDVQFEITIKRMAQFTKNGWDDVEFMISTNPGESIKPLGKVASGGELSRIMLAIKSILANTDEIGTLIFDEIDVGISGRTAQKVSEKLALIARHHQVICITHLPQIAAMADKHFVIEKSTANNKTNTTIYPLKDENIYNEIARLISGVEVTDLVLHSAKEMKELANKVKEII